MNKATLPWRTLILWQIRVVMLTTLLVGACIYYKSTFSMLSSVALIFAILGLVVVAWYLPTFFKSYQIIVDNQAVIINYGVFIKFSHVMPYPRLIYAQTFATPLARLFGVTAVSLKAARSRVIVPEIPLEEAKKVMDSLTQEVLYDKEV
jgi:membrane protein YdbS with pleckstrin-like domain